MSLADVYAPGQFGLSFEVYPPKKQSGLPGLYDEVERLCQFDPAFISITYGAGGSTQDRSLEMAEHMQRQFQRPITSHFTCVGATVDDIRQWLQKADQLGVTNIMALRGDPPQGQEKFIAVEGGLSYAVDLVKLIKSEFPRFGIGVAGYPETHQEAPDADFDLENLKRKVDAGGQVVYTQLFYSNHDFLKFRDRCTALGIAAPIVPGILPIISFKQIQRIAQMCKACLPNALAQELEKHQDDAEAQVEIGIEHASRQCDELLRAGIPGLHFYVLNKSHSAGRVLDNVMGLIPKRAAS